MNCYLCKEPHNIICIVCERLICWKEIPTDTLLPGDPPICRECMKITPHIQQARRHFRLREELKHISIMVPAWLFSTDELNPLEKWTYLALLQICKTGPFTGTYAQLQEALQIKDYPISDIFLYLKKAGYITLSANEETSPTTFTVTLTNKEGA